MQVFFFLNYSFLKTPAPLIRVAFKEDRRMELTKKFRKILPSEIEIAGIQFQDVMTRILIAGYIWFSFYLAYIDTYDESPPLADMLLYIIRFFTRPFEWVIDTLFYF